MYYLEVIGVLDLSELIGLHLGEVVGESGLATSGLTYQQLVYV